MVPDDDSPLPRPRPSHPPQQLALTRMCADLRLLRVQLTEQGKTFGDLTVQVARLTRRQDDQDARHLEIEEAVATQLGVINSRMEDLSARMDQILRALTQMLHPSEP